MTSAVMILPAAARDAGNALGASMGWGPSSYSVALSPTGSAPATHYGCCAEVSAGFLALLASPPPEAAPVLAVLTIDTRETADPGAHWHDVLAAQGLVMVSDD